MVEFSLGGVSGIDALSSVLYVYLGASMLIFLASLLGVVYSQSLFIAGVSLFGVFIGFVGFMFSAGLLTAISE